MTAMIGRLLACVFGITAVATGPAGAQTPTKITYLLPAISSLPAFAPFMLAQHKGYYRAEGLEVEFQIGKGGTDVAKQVGVGNADLGGGVGDTTVIVRPNGIPVKTVAVLGGRSLLAIAVNDGGGIDSPKDLKGKTLTVMSLEDTTYYSLLGVLAAVKLSKDDVRIQPVGPVNVWKLLVARQADGMGAVPDWIASAESAGAKLKIFASHDYFPSMPQAILASDKMIASRPEVIHKFVRAIIANPDAAAEDYIKAVPANADRLPEMKRVLGLYATLVYPGQKRLGEMDEARLVKLQDFYLKEKIIEKKTDPKALFTNAFIP
jgi:NitT/TauT family transport system substrate-binding protein